MKLAYVDPGPVPALSPAAIQILQSVDGLARAGAAVRLITPRAPPAVSVGAVLGRPLHPDVTPEYVADHRRRWYWPSGSSRPFYWLASRRLLRLARAGAVDAIVARNLKVAEVLLREPGLPPLFFETHELFAQSFREASAAHGSAKARQARVIAERERFVYRRSRGLACLTHALAEDVLAAYAPVAPIEVVPDGVDLELAASALAQPRSPNPLPALLYLGSLHRWKGVEVAIEAMPQLPRCELRIFGGSDERIAELRALAARLRLGERVLLLGRLEPRRRFAAIAEADVCLLPLRQDAIAARYTSPLKLFEYMAMGKPVVASDLPSLREVLVHHETALLVPPEDPAALAQAVTALLDDTAMASALGARAQALANARFGWPHRSARLLAFVARELATRTPLQ